MSPPDSQRSKVYAAEHFVRALFDRSAEHGSGAVEFFGSQLTLPPEGRFGSVESVRRYVDSVLSHPGVRERWPGAGPLAVRARRGVTAAHYECRAGVAAIAVPERQATWALRELVVLHEVAHHLCTVEPAHGPKPAVCTAEPAHGAKPAVCTAEPAHGAKFVAAFCELAGVVMGPEVQHVLRVVYSKQGVR